ncbi:MAG: RtcB family protein [Candidatus Ranarchaeia archaeon]
MVSIKQINKYTWEIPQDTVPGMRVPGRVFANKELVDKMRKDATLIQCSNVATLPGIYKYSIALPDAHSGYGFPIGGVAAIDADEGVISPGGIGYDINCGVRLLRTNLEVEDVQPKIKELIQRLFTNVPSGLGSHGKVKVSISELNKILENGSHWAVNNGYGWEEDLSHTEERGCLEDAKASLVSDRAKQRGKNQVGSLGSGNHFLEVQVVDKIFDHAKAKAMGVDHEGQVLTMIHTGSRGLGHQVCSDYLKTMESARRKYGLDKMVRELSCTPLKSKEGEEYFSAMAAGANFAWCNRQMIMHWVRQAFSSIFKEPPEDLDMHLIYDVAHNIGKKEVHEIDGAKRKVIVHRKGATRAFPPGDSSIPADYRSIGQPVLIPGSMGTASYVLAGTKEAMALSFGSTAHGAGRLLSRTKAKKRFWGGEVKDKLEARGISVRAASKVVLAEEADGAYKDIESVVEVSHALKIGTKVFRLRPIGVAKG